jgi:hypothetical protein
MTEQDRIFYESVKREVEAVKHRLVVLVDVYGGGQMPFDRHLEDAEKAIKAAFEALISEKMSE